MLSNQIIPEIYDLRFEVNPNKSKFNGFERIGLNILKPTSRIVLNSKNLLIKKLWLYNGSENIVPKFKFDEENELLIIDLGKKISGNFSLFVNFYGKLSEDLKGFYRSKYSYKGKEKFIATTQFEAPYARRAFPCFDEPGKKAEFNISFIIDKKLKAISNMPIKSEKSLGKKKLVEFEKTPMMSTYLAYFGIGDFEFIESTYEKKVKLRIVTTPGKKSQGRFAMDLVKKFLKYFEKYSEIKYPLPKLDLIALPDLTSAAMENWGAITFRESALLSSRETSFKMKRRIAEVIAHELWHQWSGNLVTMKWWNDLWLNESFATYMAYKALHNYFPNWKIWEYYLGEDTAWGFNKDSLKSSHPIFADVKSVHEIEEIFDGISYGKGGSVLRMFDHFLGEENFRKGVSFFLKKFAYKNVELNDFWNSLSKFSNVDIKEMARTWINQSGYPLINVEFKENKLILKQEPFQDKNMKKKWIIPITIKTEKGIMKMVLDEKRKEIRINSKNFKLNSEQNGFYRVKYSLNILKNLGRMIERNLFNSIDSFGIQNDLFNLALYGKISVDYYLKFIKSYKNHNDSLTLSDIYGNILEINWIFSCLSEWQKDNFPISLGKIMEETYFKIYSKLLWNPKKNENLDSTLLRSIAISYMSFMKNKEVLENVRKKFENPPNDIRLSVYSSFAVNGGEIEYKKILQKYLKTEAIEQKKDLLISLYKFKNLNLLRKSLDLMFSKNVRLQDWRYTFASIKSNAEMRKIYLQYVKKNWAKFFKQKETYFIFSDFLFSLIVLNFDRLPELHNFLKDKDIKYKKTLKEAFETAEVYNNFLKRNEKIIVKYLSEKN